MFKVVIFVLLFVTGLSTFALSSSVPEEIDWLEVNWRVHLDCIKTCERYAMQGSRQDMHILLQCSQEEGMKWGPARQAFERLIQNIRINHKGIELFYTQAMLSGCEYGFEKLCEFYEKDGDVLKLFELTKEVRYQRNDRYSHQHIWSTAHDSLHRLFIAGKGSNKDVIDFYGSVHFTRCWEFVANVKKEMVHYNTFVRGDFFAGKFAELSQMAKQEVHWGMAHQALEKLFQVQRLRVDAMLDVYHNAMDKGLKEGYEGLCFYCAKQRDVKKLLDLAQDRRYWLFGGQENSFTSVAHEALDDLFLNGYGEENEKDFFYGVSGKDGFKGSVEQLAMTYKERGDIEGLLGLAQKWGLIDVYYQHPYRALHDLFLEGRWVDERAAVEFFMQAVDKRLRVPGGYGVIYKIAVRWGKVETFIWMLQNRPSHIPIVLRQIPADSPIAVMLKEYYETWCRETNPISPNSPSFISSSPSFKITSAASDPAPFPASLSLCAPLRLLPEPAHVHLGNELTIDHWFSHL